MKNIIILFAFLTTSIAFTFGQEIYTKDGVPLGNRGELLQECANSIGTETVESDGLRISSKTLCKCLIDEVITNLTTEQIAEFAAMDDINEDDLMMALLIGNFGKLINCMGDDLEYVDGSPIDSKNFQGNMREIVVKTCADAMMEDDNLDGTNITAKQAHSFCSCAVDKMFDKGYTYEQIMQVDDEDGPVFNEVIMGCINELGAIAQMLNTTVYNPSDIRGGSNSSQVTLLQYANTGHKVKLSICGVEKYFLFDTGASDMIINTEIEKQLIEKGCLGEDNYLGETEYELADGTTAVGKIVVLNNVKIGDYTVDNVMVSIIDGGSLLCGHSLLNKFRNWELKGGNSLILFK